MVVTLCPPVFPLISRQTQLIVKNKELRTTADYFFYVATTITDMDSAGSQSNSLSDVLFTDHIVVHSLKERCNGNTIHPSSR